MGEAGEAWLEDGGAKEKGGTGPERFDGCSSELLGDDLSNSILGFHFVGMREVGPPTGNATDKDVPSSATIIVITARVMNAKYRRNEGFHSVCGPSSRIPEILDRMSAWGSRNEASENWRCLPTVTGAILKDMFGRL